MKKSITLLLFALLCTTFSATAQSRGDNTMKTAQKYLDNKEYTQARYYFLQAFSQYANEKNFGKAVTAGVNGASLYHRENYYKEAFEQLAKVDRMLIENKDTVAADLSFYPAKERFTMFMKLRNAPKANEWLNRMRNIAKTSGGNKFDNDLLYDEATYNYTFGNTAGGDVAINKLIGGYEKNKDYKKADECFRQLISIATNSKNARLVNRVYERYNQWTDSITRVQEKSELAKISNRLDEANRTIEEKDSALSVKTGIIVTLFVVIGILAAVLVLGAIMLLRKIATERRAKKNLAIANEHNELKTQFIHSISEQMEPTLNTLDQSLPAVRALKDFAHHIQTLSDLESSIDEHYEPEEVNLLKFGELVGSQVKPLLKPGVSLSVNVPKMVAKFDPQPTEAILVHLLKNAALYTEEGGKISLEFKKRGARSFQFIVTDSGCGIPEEKRDDIFKPFTEIKDLTTGDGLGLPICALMAEKLNGTLSLDKEFNHGTRFILEIHS